MPKKWQLLPSIPQDFKDKFPEINPIILQLLYNRGLLTSRTIHEFLDPSYTEHLYDPFLLSQIDKIISRIFEAIKKQEKIVVHGDYDADGICGSIILMETLKFLGAENLDVYLPHREKEGYGLHIETVEELAKQGTKLIITVDCGITNFEEILKAKELGIEVIVTDHHHPPFELPAAYGIIHPALSPKYPFKELAGVGVAFKLMQALLKKDLKEKKENLVQDYEGFEKWRLDLVALGTVTDMMPLRGENRVLVKYGIIVLNKTKRIGLKKLLEIARTRMIDTESIGFQIGPRLNAAGRINHANLAYHLLTSTDESKAQRIALILNQTNQERQKLTEEMLEKGKKQIDTIQDSEKFLFVFDKDWPLGVIGLVAGKICDLYYRPTIALTQKEDEIVGSGRSIPEFNLIEALELIPQYFSRFGGHSGACGFTLKDINLIEDFKKDLKKIAERKLTGLDLEPVLPIDTELSLEDITWDLFKELEKFKPFGENNEKPKFLAKVLELVNIEIVGREGKHRRIWVSPSTNPNNTKYKLMIFGMNNKEEWSKLQIGDKIDVVFEISANEWNGISELQFKVADIKKSKIKI